MIPTPLSALLARRRRSAHDVVFDVPEDWMQGRTSFGGLVSVDAVQAMRDVAAAEGGLPFSGTPGWRGSVHLRLRDPDAARLAPELSAAGQGYLNQQGLLWSPGGALAALAYRVVTVYG